jgi:hypothetical protein
MKKTRKKWQQSLEDFSITKKMKLYLKAEAFNQHQWLSSTIEQSY